MKKLLILLLLFPSTMLAQSEELMDSVNYYFSILLNNERDSINRANINNRDFIFLDSVKVETDKRKFVNPDKHLSKIISDMRSKGRYTPHSTTNKENFLGVFSPMDLTLEYHDPKKVAKEFFNRWKKSPGHYDFMVNGGTWSDNPYQTFVVRYKMTYKGVFMQDGMFLLAATFTVF